MTTATQTTAGLLPLRQYPKGLTVIPAAHRAAFDAARAAAREHAQRYGLDVEDGPLAAMFLHLQGELSAMADQLGQARAETTAVRDQLDAATADLARMREEQAAAALRKRQAAERRDRRLREAVHGRDGDACRYCDTQVSFERGSGLALARLDHVDPGQAAGEANLVVACRPCVRSKDHRSPELAGMVLLPAPDVPRFTPTREEEPVPDDRTDAVSDGDQRASNCDMVAEMAAMSQRQCLPDWVRFETNSRTGFVTMELADLAELAAWAQALGHTDEPRRFTYATEGLVRYNASCADALSGWRFDLNAKFMVPTGMPVNDDVLDAIEMTLEAGSTSDGAR